MSCNAHENKKVKPIQKNEVTPFDLATDYRQFSKKLNIGDSILFHFDLAVCTGSDHAYLTFTKKNNEEIILYSHLTSDYVDTLFTTIYQIENFKLDSIIANGIIDSLPVQSDMKLEEITESADCEISINNDTLLFYSEPGITEKIDHISRFENELKSLYAQIKRFGGVEKPPKNKNSN